jgi:hypothetical protein
MRHIATISFVLCFALTSPILAESIPVFTPGDEGKPFVDVYASGLYAAECVEGAGCSCAAMPLDRNELAAVLGLEAVGAEIQGLWNSPAAEDELTAESSDALHARFGGSGYCPQSALEPTDGVWRDGKPFNVSVQCGAATEMFRQVLSNQELDTARIQWNGAFSGATIQTAFITAAPDPEYTPHEFKDVTPVETIGTLSMRDEGGTITSTGRMRLLTPKLFAVNWEVKGMNESGPCNWSMEQLVSWVGE